MSLFARLMARGSRVAPVTPSTRRLAYAVAIVTDVLQLAMGPLGWAGADEVLDVVAGVALWRLLGFHPLLLPTFMLEFLPMTDMLPTWTGCVALVTATAGTVADDPPPPTSGDVIQGTVVDSRPADTAGSRHQ